MSLGLALGDVIRSFGPGLASFGRGDAPLLRFHNGSGNEALMPMICSRSLPTFSSEYSGPRARAGSVRSRRSTETLLRSSTARRRNSKLLVRAALVRCCWLRAAEKFGFGGAMVSGASVAHAQLIQLQQCGLVARVASLALRWALSSGGFDDAGFEQGSKPGGITLHARTSRKALKRSATSFAAVAFSCAANNPNASERMRPVRQP